VNRNKYLIPNIN